MSENKDWNTLEEFCSEIWGKTWQAELTRALELSNSSHVRGWKRRGVPSWVWDELKEIAQHKIEVISKILVKI